MTNTSGYNNEPKDMYDPATNTLNIRSNGQYPSNVLSNLCSNGFRFDGMMCGSMEGFLQSLKQQDLDKQLSICSMKGGNARKRSITSWQTDQIVWWKGRAINRQSEEFAVLVRGAYQAMFDQNERFRTALMQTRGMNLSHTDGEDNPYKTILTPTEFCGILENLREEYDKRLTKELKPIVENLDTCERENRQDQLFRISPVALIERKLVIRATLGSKNIEDLLEQLRHRSVGLCLERITELGECRIEVVMCPSPQDDVNANYELAVDVSGESTVCFLTEDQKGRRDLIGEYHFS